MSKNTDCTSTVLQCTDIVQITIKLLDIWFDTNIHVHKNSCSCKLLFSKKEKQRNHHSFKIDIEVGIKYAVSELLALIVCFNQASLSKKTLNLQQVANIWGLNIKVSNYILNN